MTDKIREKFEAWENEQYIGKNYDSYGRVLNKNAQEPAYQAAYQQALDDVVEMLGSEIETLELAVANPFRDGTKAHRELVAKGLEALTAIKQKVKEV